MSTKPCIVCDYPVEIEEAEMQIHQDKERFKKESEQGTDHKMRTLAVCSNPRCLRLVTEALKEENQRRIS